MLTHSVIGPSPDGRYFAVYPTPGTLDNVTIAADCNTRRQAQAEADRLNHEQEAREEAIQVERELCGFRRIQIDLGRAA